MSKWFKIGITGLLVFGAVAALITGAALAQDDTPTVPEPTVPKAWDKGFGPGRGHGFGPGIRSQVGMEAAAEALGMTSDELSNQLWGGKTLADLAEEKGVDLAELRTTVEAAVKAEMVTQMREAIQTAVDNGTITQENADWLLQGLDKGFIPGFGFGHGGRGGFGRGHKGFGPPPASLPATPSGGA